MFPWDAAAARPGDPFTPQYVLPADAQTGGRFDLSDTPTLYVAPENPAHALAEVSSPCAAGGRSAPATGAPFLAWAAEQNGPAAAQLPSAAAPRAVRARASADADAASGQEG